MKSHRINLLNNILMFAIFAVSAVSGVIILLRFPIFVLMHDWKTVHNISSIALIISVLIHLALHKSYIANINKMIKER